MDDGANLSLRLMNIIHLARVAKEIGRTDILSSSLEEWIVVWERACCTHPKLAKVESLGKWDAWVRATLGSSK